MCPHLDEIVNDFEDSPTPLNMFNIGSVSNLDDETANLPAVTTKAILQINSSSAMSLLNKQFSPVKTRLCRQIKE